MYRIHMGGVLMKPQEFNESIYRLKDRILVSSKDLIKQIREEENIFKRNKFESDDAVEIYIELLEKYEYIIDILSDQYTSICGEYRDFWQTAFVQGAVPTRKDESFEDQFEGIIELRNQVKNRIARVKKTLSESLEEEKKNQEENDKNKA